MREEEIARAKQEKIDAIRRRIEPLLAMRDKLSKHMPIVRPLFNQIDGTLTSAILSGDLEINWNPTYEEMAEYTRPL